MPNVCYALTCWLEHLVLYRMPNMSLSDEVVSPIFISRREKLLMSLLNVTSLIRNGRRCMKHFGCKKGNTCTCTCTCISNKPHDFLSVHVYIFMWLCYWALRCRDTWFPYDLGPYHHFCWCPASCCSLGEIGCKISRFFAPWCLWPLLELRNWYTLI